MDEQSNLKLNSILSKHISSVTDTDRKFLTARSSYLTPEQTELYLNETKKETTMKYEDLLQAVKDKGHHVPKRLPRVELEKMLEQ